LYAVVAALAITVLVAYVAWHKLGRRGTRDAATVRAEREREEARALLAQRVAEQRAVAELGRRARETLEPVVLMADATRLVQQTLVVASAEVLELQPDLRTLRQIAASGFAMPFEDDPTVTAGAGSYSRFALRAQDPVTVDDLSADERFELPAGLVERGMRSSASVVVRGRGGPLGLLRVHCDVPARFDAGTADFLEVVANVIGSALDHSVSEDESRRQALTDALTGLPNRTLFNDRLERALALARRRDGQRVAVLLLDVDQFKMVNDSLGHQAGDELLVTLAPRLLAAVRDTDTVARLGGDEFVILCEGLVDEEEALELADRVAEALREPVRIEGRELFVTASTGVAVSTNAGETPSTLLRHADAAMYRAKESGRGRAALYGEHMRGRALDRLRIENDLRRALERGELSLVYQPIVDLHDGRTCGVEALLRWAHPERGNIAPDVFIPIAEETGLIVPIGRWVLEHACEQVAEWQRTMPGAQELELTVNVSGHQLFQGSLRADLERVLRESGIRPGTLGLEITESILMDEGEPLILLAGLRGAGARLLLDDFGTGYSSLSYLKRFPLDVLKVDRSFVDGLGEDGEDSAIVSTIVAMAQTLGLGVIAEGVETEAQLRHLRELGCERAQGYLLARPLPPSELDTDGVLRGASLLPASLRA
jgi:diguanylate cyclase (GGDEF)-like protein